MTRRLALVAAVAAISVSVPALGTDAPAGAQAVGTETALCSESDLANGVPLDVLLMMDESNSLRTDPDPGTDPEGQRVVAAQQFVKALEPLAATNDVRIGLAGFGVGAREYRPISSVPVEQFDALSADIEAFRDRDDDLGTDYVAALDKSVEMFGAVPDGARCRILLWFTDGLYFVSGDADADAAQLREAVCGGAEPLATSLRAGEGVHPVVVLLDPRNELPRADDVRSQASIEVLRDLTQDGSSFAGPASPCGTGSSTGRLLKAQSLGELIGTFDGLAQAIAGGEQIGDWCSGTAVAASPPLPAGVLLRQISVQLYAGNAGFRAELPGGATQELVFTPSAEASEGVQLGTIDPAGLPAGWRLVPAGPTELCAYALPASVRSGLTVVPGVVVQPAEVSVTAQPAVDLTGAAAVRLTPAISDGDQTLQSDGSGRFAATIAANRTGTYDQLGLLAIPSGTELFQDGLTLVVEAPPTLEVRPVSDLPLVAPQTLSKVGDVPEGPLRWQLTASLPAEAAADATITPQDLALELDGGNVVDLHFEGGGATADRQVVTVPKGGSVSFDLVGAEPLANTSAATPAEPAPLVLALASPSGATATQELTPELRLRPRPDLGTAAWWFVLVLIAFTLGPLLLQVLISRRQARFAAPRHYQYVLVPGQLALSARGEWRFAANPDHALVAGDVQAVSGDRTHLRAGSVTLTAVKPWLPFARLRGTVDGGGLSSATAPSEGRRRGRPSVPVAFSELRTVTVTQPPVVAGDGVADTWSAAAELTFMFPQATPIKVVDERSTADLGRVEAELGSWLTQRVAEAEAASEADVADDAAGDAPATDSRGRTPPGAVRPGTVTGGDGSGGAPGEPVPARPSRPAPPGGAPGTGSPPPSSLLPGGPPGGPPQGTRPRPWGEPPR